MESIITITLSLLLVGYVLAYLHKANQLKIHRKFIEDIASELVPYVNGDRMPVMLSWTRNEIKMFLIMQKYKGKKLKQFKERQSIFIKKYDL